MPSVPVARNLVGVADLTDAKLRPADFSSGAAIGEGMQQLGRAGQQFAQAQDAMYAKMDETAAKKLDIEGTERVRQILWTGDNAYYKQQGFDAANARAGTEKALKELRDELAGRTTSKRQLSMFESVFDRRIGQEYEGVARHATQESSREEERTSIARTETYRQEAITYADDPVRFKISLDTGISEINKRADRQGWSPDVAKAAVAKFTSDVRASIVDGKVRSDPVSASAYLEQYRDEIDPDTERKLRDSLYAPMLERKAVAIVDSYQGVTEIDTPKSTPGGGSTFSRMVGITSFTESRNRDRDSNGNIVTSPKGARGSMQVMPGTEGDPGFGVKPAQDNTDAERARVGRDYLGAMLKRYNGDAAKAWAAYNGGPGRLDQAISAKGNAWLSAMPKETRDYVATNMAALSGDGTPRYSPRRDDLAGIYSYIEGRTDLTFDEKQSARREADNRVSRNDMLLRRQQDAAGEQIDGLLDNPNVRSIKDIPPSLLRQAKPGTMRQVENILESRNRPEPPKTDYGFMTTLSDAYGSNKQAFLSISPLEARSKLSDGDYEQYLGWRRDAMKPGSAKTEGQITHARIIDVTADALATSGIATGSGKEAMKPDMAARRGSFTTAMSNAVQEWQAYNQGKTPSDDDLKRMAAALLLKTNSGALVFEATGIDLEGSIPDNIRNNIIRSLKAAGIPSTPPNIAEAYRRGATLMGTRPRQ